MRDRPTNVDSAAAFERDLEALLQQAFEADLDLEGGWECSIEDGPELDVVLTRLSNAD